MLKKGRLVVISAPSGTGKTTIVERLLERNRNMKRSISFTTRLPRGKERHGKDYYFISQDEFKKRKKKGFFLESAKVFDRYYGTSKKFVLDKINRGKHLILAIDVQGMKQIQKKGKQIPMVSIFIMPPSKSILKKRLVNRRTETKEQINKRLKIAQREIKERSRYDYIVTNRKVGRAVQEIEEILEHVYS